MVIILGCLSRSDDEAGVATAIGLINLGLIVAGFVLGVVALISMRVYGRERILGRALVGVLVNGLLLVSAAALLLPLFSLRRVSQQIAGRWQFQAQAAQDAPPAEIVLDLASDGRFRMTRNDSAGGAVASFSGNW